MANQVNDKKRFETLRHNEALLAEMDSLIHVNLVGLIHVSNQWFK